MSILISLLILVVVVMVVLWLVDKLGVDAGAQRIITVIVVAIALIYLLGILTGYAPILWPHQR